MLEDRMKAQLRSDPAIRAKVKQLEARVADGRVAPALAAEGADRGVAAVTPRGLFIVRGGGRSSHPQCSFHIARVAAYWMPAFAGMMAEVS